MNDITTGSVDLSVKDYEFFGINQSYVDLAIMVGSAIADPEILWNELDGVVGGLTFDAVNTPNGKVTFELERVSFSGDVAFNSKAELKIELTDDVDFNAAAEIRVDSTCSISRRPASPTPGWRLSSRRARARASPSIQSRAASRTPRGSSRRRPWG